jgi:hypothetical protein
VGRDLSTVIEREAQRAASPDAGHAAAQARSYPPTRLVIGPTLVVADVLFGRRSIAALIQVGWAQGRRNDLGSEPTQVDKPTLRDATSGIPEYLADRAAAHAATRNGVVWRSNAYHALTGVTPGLGLPTLLLKSLRNLVGAAGFEPAT